MPPVALGQPEIFWVVGNNTNVGKTTLSTALIRTLNNIGKKTIGFKPYAGLSFVDHIDFMVKAYPKTKARVFGEDALKLAVASPLTSEDLVEVIAPSYRLHFPSIRHTVLARVGAQLLGNRKFFCSRETSGFSMRADVKRISDMVGLPFNEAIVLNDGVGVSGFDLMLPDERARAYDYLRGLGAETFVLEGAGGYLPVWRGGPMPNHVLIVTEDLIHFFPSISVRIDVEQPNRRVTSTRLLLERLGDLKYQPVSSHKYLVESKHRDSVADKLILTLLNQMKQ